MILWLSQEQGCLSCRCLLLRTRSLKSTWKFFSSRLHSATHTLTPVGKLNLRARGFVRKLVKCRSCGKRIAVLHVTAGGKQSSFVLSLNKKFKPVKSLKARQLKTVKSYSDEMMKGDVRCQTCEAREIIKHNLRQSLSKSTCVLHICYG